MKIEPFRIRIDDHDIEDLRRRLRETQWSQSVEGAGWEMGMDAAYLRSLSDYWRNQFDWRTVEVTLNRPPLFQARSDSRTDSSSSSSTTDTSACAGSARAPEDFFARLVMNRGCATLAHERRDTKVYLCSRLRSAHPS
jgi:hypothetical protein